MKARIIVKRRGTRYFLSRHSNHYLWRRIGNVWNYREKRDSIWKPIFINFGNIEELKNYNLRWQLYEVSVSEIQERI
jgi:hypothetical protein